MYSKPQYRFESADVKRGKRLSYLLRHGAEKEGLHIKTDGFVSVTEVLAKFDNCTLDDIKRVVANDSKNRFTLHESGGIAEIKANQGHSIVNVDNLNLRLVKNPTFHIIHGTCMKYWPSIKTQGLSRMNRNHIHFAKDLNTECGLRRSADVYIFIDFKKATDGGLKFFESENGVILSTGDAKGFIKSRYFSKVVDRSNKSLLYDSR